MNVTTTHRRTGAVNLPVLCLAAVLAATIPTRADGPAALVGNDLRVTLVAQKVVLGADGKEQLQPAERAFPGEIVQYDAHYTNVSERLLMRVAPTLPIPRGMAYVPASALPAPDTASLDGKTFEPIPIKRKVTLPNGETEEREVPPTEYRALRWSVGDLDAGTATNVVARVRLLATTP